MKLFIKTACAVALTLSATAVSSAKSNGDGKFIDFYKNHPYSEIYKALYNKYDPSKANVTVKKDKMLADGRMHVVPVGPLQMWVAALPEKDFLIITDMVENGLAAKYKLQKWDEIIGVNGAEFSKPHTATPAVGTRGPVYDLAMAIESSQLKGKLMLLIRRNGKTRPVKIPIEKLSRFTKTYPYKCSKSRALLDEAAGRLTTAPGKNSVGLAMRGISLLATGEKKYLESVENIIDKIMSSGDQMGYNNPMRVSEYTVGNSWMSGFSLILMAEYFWATGDEKVFATLQQMAYQVGDRHQNPFGGFGHGSGMGTYAGISFGAPAPMNILGMALAEKCGAKVEHKIFHKYYEMITGDVLKKASGSKERFKYDPDQYYQVGYSAGLGKCKGPGKMGQSALNTGATAMALAHAPISEESREIARNLVRTLSGNVEMFGYTHTAGSLGMFWSHLAQSYIDRSNYRRALDYRRYWLTLSRTPEKAWLYVYPKRSAAGGWGGDGYLGLENCQLSICTLLLSSYRNRLLMLGNKKRNWLSGKNPKETLSFIKKYHSFYASKLAEQGKKLQTGKSKDEAKKALATFHKAAQLYSAYPGGKESAKRLKSLKGKIGAKKANYLLKMSEVDPYLGYLEKLKGRVKLDIKKKLLATVVKENKELKLEKEAERLTKHFEKAAAEYIAQKNAESESDSDSERDYDNDSNDNDKKKKKKKKKKK